MKGALGLTKPSALVEEALSLNTTQRQTLEISEQQLAFGDLIFRVVQLLLDDDDPRPLWDRLEELDEIAGTLLEGLQEVDLEKFNSDEVQLPRRLRHINTPSFRRFARKLLGPSRIHKLSAAAREDAAVAAIAVRRSLRSLLSLAAAADSCIGVLKPEQRDRIDGLSDLSGSSFLEVAVQLDNLINRADEKGIHLSPALARPSELADLPGPLGDLATTMQAHVSDQSLELLEDMSGLLTRKIRGARDAMDYSSDGISQAANSLVELIDRMLRDAFPKPVVLEWIGKAFPDGRSDLTYVHESGQIRPTKRGEALCFAYGGQISTERSLIQEIAASAVVECRTGLQKLKHADVSTDAEETSLFDLLHVIEAATVLIVKIAWLGVDNTQLEQLRSRLALAA